MDSGLDDAGPGGLCIDGGSARFDWALEGNLAGTLLESIRGADHNAQGDVVVCGNFSNTASIGSATLTSRGASDLFAIVFGSTGRLLWARSFGGTGADLAIDCDFDGSGNVLVGGRFQGTVTFAPGVAVTASGGGTDLLILKLSQDGQPIWARSAGGAGEDVVNELAADDADQVYLAIQYTSPTLTFPGSSVTLDQAGEQDAAVAKYSSQGAFLWARRVGGDGRDLARGIDVDASGNVAFVGESQGTFLAVANEPPAASRGGFEMFITKWSSEGTLQWWKRIGGPGEDSARGAGIDGAGNLYAAGKFTGAVDFGGQTVSSQSGSTDLFVARFGLTGEVQWVNTIGSDGREEGCELTVTPRGAVSVSGDFTRTATFSSTAAPQTISTGDAAQEFIATWSATGVLEWVATGGGPGSEVNYDIGAGAGGVTIVGTTSGGAVFGATTLSAGARVYIAHAIEACVP
jgi:hypothetical protein